MSYPFKVIKDIDVPINIKPNVRIEQSEDKIIIIDDIHGEFYECNDTALFMIRKIYKGITREELIKQIIDNYDIENYEAHAEVDRFLNSLFLMGILEQNK